MESSITLSYINDFEVRCILAEFENSNFKDLQFSGNLPNDALGYILACISKGDYNSVLQINLIDYELFSSEIYLDNPEDFIRNFINDENDFQRQVLEFILIFIGISALQEFVRCNFSGPRDKIDNYQVISELLPDAHVSDSEICLQLSLDGESVYPNVVHPKLLCLSRLFLSHTYASTSSSLTQKWWYLRCVFIHQCVLSEKSQLLHNSLSSLVTEIYHTDWLEKEENICKKLVFLVECSQMFLYYGDLAHARRYIKDAQNITGLEIELSGAMGKKTQYQQKAVAQLFVKLKRSHLNFSGTFPNKNDLIPADIRLQDDVLLNKVAFIDDNEQVLESLCAEEQVVLLGYCCLVYRSGCFDELLQEEIMAYINCLLSQPQVWALYLKALIMRCRVEKNSSRRLERSITQMEALVDSIRKTLPPLREREKFFYCTSFPPYWKLEKDLADLWLSVGFTKEALEIYERLEMWEEIVNCCILLGRTKVAEEIVRAQLEKGESPMLLCLLGDVTENTEHYLRAWELSDHKSARAQRSLGYYYFKRKEYETSLPHFVTSLEINHLQPQVWFSAGHAATQAENFELAARAYRQVVLFDEDSFEAWNNLANAYIKMGQKVRAWRSLQEALKGNYEEWRVWENFLLVSTDVGAFEDALRAWHRLLDVKGKHCDSLLLEILVTAIINDLPDINGLPSSRLKKRTMVLLGRITSITTNDPKVWELYSSLTNFNSEEAVDKDTLEKVVHFQQKAFHCYNQKGSWERDFSLSKEVLACSQKLANLYSVYIKLLEGTAHDQQKMSARLNLQNVILRVRRFIDFFPDYEKNELNDILGTLQSSFDEILAL